MAYAQGSWAAVARPTPLANNYNENSSKKNEFPPLSDKEAIGALCKACKNLEAAHKQAMEVATEGREALQKEKLMVEKKLNEALKKLVILQPRQQSSDELIQQLFEELCQNIEDCADSDFTNVVKLSERTVSVDWTSVEASVVFKHFTQDDAELSKLFPEINSNILMSMVFSWLFEICLNEDKWCCTGSQDEENMLNNVAKAIIQQNPAGGNILSNRWRTETYLALSNLSDRSQKQADIMWRFNGIICRVLNKLTHRPLNYANFRDKILNKAFKLARLMKSSITRYSFSFPPVSATSDVLLKLDQTSSLRLVDAHTGVGIDLDTLKDHGDTAGKLRLCVFPGLSKIQDDGSVVPMVKALVVLEKSKQLNVGQKPKESDEKLKESSGKLETTNEKLQENGGKLEENGYHKPGEQ